MNWLAGDVLYERAVIVAVWSSKQLVENGLKKNTEASHIVEEAVLGFNAVATETPMPALFIYQSQKGP